MRVLSLAFVGFVFAVHPVSAADIGIPGDSISAPSDSGAWAVGQGYGAIIAARKGFTEINVAVSGATLVPAAGAPANEQAQWDALIARSPKPIGILTMLGSNDTYWQTDAPTFQSILDAKVAAALAAGIPVTLLTTWPRQIPSTWYTCVPPYVQAIRAVGAKYGVVVVDVFAHAAELALTNPTLFQSYFYTGDGINAHPTAAGQAWIASLLQLPQYAASFAYSVAPPVPVPQIPIMSATTTAGVTITGNDLNSMGTLTSAPVWMMQANPVYTIQFNQGGAGWVTVQFPAPFVPASYSLRADPRTSAGAQAYAPKIRTLQGWNGVGWDDLDQVTNESAWGVGEVRSRALSGVVAYSLFRVNVTASQGGTYLQFRELQISK